MYCAPSGTLIGRAGEQAEQHTNKAHTLIAREASQPCCFKPLREWEKMKLFTDDAL
jgi:hypothetical protein